MDSKNFAIGVLCTTATILLVGVVLVYSQPEPAMAAGVSVSGGDYTLSVASLDRTDEELVYVIDTPQEKMLVYRFDTNKQRVEIVKAFDLHQIREAAAAELDPSKKPPAGRRP